MKSLIINPAQQIYGEEEILAAYQVLKSGHWAEGDKSLDFRYQLKKFLNVNFAELTNSGSSANLAAIIALTTHWIPKERRLVKGSEVITPALCFPTTASPIFYAGCKPVFVDVEEGTWNIDPNEVKKAVTKKTRAIVATHNLGNPFDIDRIVEIAKENNLYLIEDNCDGLGSEWDGEKTGGFGDVSTLSFYPAHHISTGEGGAVCTNDPIIERAVRSIINWGRDCWCSPGKDNTCGHRYDLKIAGLPYGYDHKNTFAELGFNLKMTDIQAAIGIEQLKRINKFTEARRENWDYIHNQIFDKYLKWFYWHIPYEKANPSWFGYIVKLMDNTPFTRDEMVKALDEMGLRSRAFFCGNITKQPCLWRKKGYRIVGDLRVSNEMMNNSFWIGVHPGIEEEQRTYMGKVITNFLNKYNV